MTTTDRERAREIAERRLLTEDSAIVFEERHDLAQEIEAALASARAETVEQAAMLVAGWSTAVNAKAMIKIEENHCEGVAERDFAIADAIRALLNTGDTDG